MFDAMNTMRGSMCTLHVRHPDGVLCRLAELLMRYGAADTLTGAWLTVVNALDYIVYIDMINETADRWPPAPVRLPRHRDRRSRRRRHARPPRPSSAPAPTVAPGPGCIPNAPAPNCSAPASTCSGSTSPTACGRSRCDTLTGGRPMSPAALAALAAAAPGRRAAAGRHRPGRHPPPGRAAAHLERPALAAAVRRRAADSAAPRPPRAARRSRSPRPLAVWLLTGWPVGGLIAGLAVLGVPWLLTVGAAERRMIARLEAVETWTRRLKDLVQTGHGLISGIVTSARTAPPPSPRRSATWPPSCRPAPTRSTPWTASPTRSATSRPTRSSPR